MSIKITNQTNEQECGVCVLTTLHNYYFDDKIEKEQILEKSQITENGMTLFDFESLGSNLGLECESYEIQFSEFKNLKINKYFVLLVSTNNTKVNHYVIGRKRKQYIEILDSCSSKISKISYDELQKIFLNVIVLINKKPNPLFNKIFGKVSEILLFDLKFVLLNLLLSILILGVSIGSASFLNYVIEKAIGESSINNLITISFIFIWFYFANDLMSYISNLYMSSQIKNYSILFTNKILSCLSNKNLNFLDKVDKNWIFKIDECVHSIANYITIEINKLISSIIFVVSCICIIGVIQYYLLIFIFAYAIIEFVFFLFTYRKKKQMFIQIIRSENANSQYYKNLLNFLTKELWCKKKQKIISSIKNNYTNIFKNYSDVILFKSISTLMKSALKSFIEVCLIAVMGYLIIKTNILSIGKLTFVISAFALYKNSTSDLLNFFILKIEFNVYWQVYKDLVNIGKVNSYRKINTSKSARKIIFHVNENEVEIKSNVKINFINQPIIQIIKKANWLSINDSKMQIDEQLLNSIVVLDQSSSTDISILYDEIEKDPVSFAKYIKYFKLDLNTIPSFYQTLIINILSLINEKDKIIFIDDLLSFIKKDDLVVLKQLLFKIKKNNSVFICERGRND